MGLLSLSSESGIPVSAERKLSAGVGVGEMDVGSRRVDDVVVERGVRTRTSSVSVPLRKAAAGDFFW